MKTLRLLFLLFVAVGAYSQQIPARVDNPILPGFHPDPSICRVGDDYYLCNSSFTWYPGLPIYHSKDLVNWELVGHVIDRPRMVSLDGVKGKDGIYAPTLRHHNGTWYVFYFVAGSGNYYVTAKDVRGPWSDPVKIKDMPGIDPSPFWDVDGRSYVVGNHWGHPNRKYAASTAIWIQETDLAKGELIGERHYLTTGHAFNAKFAEGAHLYYIDGKYVLLVAEGGTDYYHAESVLVSDSIFGPYLAQTINPVLSQRQLGHQAPIQCVGHCDLVQTQYGDWYAVALGKRMVSGKYAFTRETFLCPVKIQDGEFVFNPGYGSMTSTIIRPNLPWTPVEKNVQWYFERIPHTDFCSLNGGQYTLTLLPETVDSLVSPAMLMRKPTSLSYSVETRLSFDAKPNEQAGLILYRNNNAYVAILKTKGELQVVCKEKGRKMVLSTIPCQAREVELRLTVDGINASIEYGQTSGKMLRAADVSLVPLTEDEQENRFNGIGVGIYASSNGVKSKSRAIFERLDYTDRGN